MHLGVSQPGSGNPEDSNLPVERKSCKAKKGVSSTYMGFFQLMWIKNRQLKTESGLHFQNSLEFTYVYLGSCVRWLPVSLIPGGSLEVTEGVCACSCARYLCICEMGWFKTKPKQNQTPCSGFIHFHLHTEKLR